MDVCSVYMFAKFYVVTDCVLLGMQCIESKFSISCWPVLNFAMLYQYVVSSQFMHPCYDYRPLIINSVLSELGEGGGGRGAWSAHTLNWKVSQAAHHDT